MQTGTTYKFIAITLLSIGLNNLSFAQVIRTTPTTIQPIPSTTFNIPISRFLIPATIQPTTTDSTTVSPSPATTTPSTQTPGTNTDPRTSPTGEVLTPTPVTQPTATTTQPNTPPQEPIPSNNTPTDTTATGQIRPRNNTPKPQTLPPEQIPPQICPPLDPLSNQNVECPKVETKTIQPKIPTQLIVTPILGVGLFWLFFSILNKQQTKSSQRISKFQLARSTQQTISNKREESYQELLDFLTTKSLHSNLSDSITFQDISAQIEILGSPQMRELNQSIKSTLESGKIKTLKPLIQKVIIQIKLDSQI